jgi:flagellar hook-basal body complex protein FliE
MSGEIGQVNKLVPGLLNSIGNKPESSEETKEGKFSVLLSNLIESVNDLQQDAGKMQELMATGDAAELHQIMIAAEKAGISMDLLLEIRNRLVEGYQNLIKMPM